MSQTRTPSAWCADLQAKLMAVLDAAWALAEASDDPAVIARVRDKARLCGQMAAAARKVAALVPQKAEKALPAAMREVISRVEAATAPLVREVEAKPAAQAVAMQAALRKLKRR